MTNVSRRQVLGYGAATAAAGVAGLAIGNPASASVRTAAEDAVHKGTGTHPAAARPRFRYWWPGGGITAQEITAEVDAMADAGFGGFEIADVRNSQHVAMPVSAYGWGTGSWKAGVTAALRTAARRGLRADLTIGPYWPAVVPGIKPDDDAAMKELTYGQASVAGGARFRGAVPAPHSAPSGASAGPAVTVTPVLEAVHAAQSVGGTPVVLKASTLIDLTDRVSKGALDWTAPAGGDWVVVASWSRGTAMIEKQAYYEGYFYPFTDPQAYVVDHFGAPGAEAIIGWWEGDLLTSEMRGLLREVGETFFEDSLEFNTELHWTPRMRAEFRARRGYDLRALLPFVHGQDTPVYVSDDTTTGAGVRWDYFQTLSDLFIANHVEKIDGWARTLGMRFRNQAYGAPLDSGLAAASTGVPEGESLAFGSTPDSFRLLAAGRDLGHRGVLSCELGAEINQAYRLTLADLAKVANASYAYGVNQVRIHGFSYAYAPASLWPGFDPWAPLAAPINFGESWTPRIPQWQVISDLSGYMTRTQAVLQAGASQVDVAIYRQEFDSTTTQYDGTALTQAGYSYQVVSWGLLPKAGDAYGALILDGLDSLLLASAEQLRAYGKAGLPVVIVGGVPDAVPNLDRDGRQAAKLKSVLATLKAQHVATPADVPAALAKAGVTPGAKAGGLLHVCRRAGDTTYHYLHNPATSTFTGDVTLRGSGVPSRIDAWTGVETPLAVYDGRTRGYLTVPVTAAAGEAVIIKVSRGSTPRHAVEASAPLVATKGGLVARTTVAGKVTALLDNGRRVTAVAAAPPAAPTLGSWDVTVEDWRPTNPASTGTGAVATTKIVHKLTLAALKSWQQIDGLADVSGVGTYTTSFVAKNAAEATLDLGSVGAGSAKVTVNGRDVGPVNHINPVIDVELRKGENTLVVTVTTTLMNRLRAQQPASYTQPAQDYGLLGPVTITPYAETRLS